MPAETLPLEDAPMLPPLVLRPPLGPRVLRAMVLALAAIFHLFTAGWNPIANGREGDLAGAARLLVLERGWLPAGMESPTGPLTIWLSKASMNLLGTGEFGARLPTALAVLAMVWLAIRLGERFGGAWRGFVAGMMLLCMPGMFTLGRTLTPGPLQAAFVATFFLCLQRGYERRTGRRNWFFCAWLALAGAFLAGGSFLPVSVCLLTAGLLAVFYRKARLRFRALLLWEGALVVLFLLAGAAVCGFPWPPSSVPATGAKSIIGWQAALLFPWSLFLVPAIWSVAVRLAARRSLEWGEAFPLLWMGTGLAAAAVAPQGSLFDTLAVWPAAALWGARGLEMLSRRGFLRSAAAVFALMASSLVLTGRIKAGVIGLFPAIADFVHGIPAFFWPSIASVVFIALLAFALFAAVAFALDLSHHRRFAVIALFGAMLPAGYAFTDIAAKLSPYFSCAEIALCVSGASVEAEGRTAVFVDGSRFGASSLRFYLAPAFLPFSIAPDPAWRPEEAAALWQLGRNTLLVARRARLALWREAAAAGGRPGEGLQIACESGGSVLLKMSDR